MEETTHSKEKYPLSNPQSTNLSLSKEKNNHASENPVQPPFNLSYSSVIVPPAITHLSLNTEQPKTPTPSQLSKTIKVTMSSGANMTMTTKNKENINSKRRVKKKKKKTSSKLINAKKSSGNSNDKIYTFKVLVVGNCKSGKSSFIRRVTNQGFDDVYKSTIGADFFQKEFDWKDPSIASGKTEEDATVNNTLPLSTKAEENEKTSSGVQPSSTTACSKDTKKIRLRLWDIAGQDRFAKLTRAYFRGASGAIVVSDVTRMASVNAAAKWKSELDHCVPNLPVMFIANKSDLFENSNDAFEAGARMQALCNKHKFSGWFATSCKEGTNIDMCMNTLTNHMMKKREERKKKREMKLRKQNSQTGKKKKKKLLSSKPRGYIDDEEDSEKDSLLSANTKKEDDDNDDDDREDRAPHPESVDLRKGLLVSEAELRSQGKYSSYC